MSLAQYMRMIDHSISCSLETIATKTREDEYEYEECSDRKLHYIGVCTNTTTAGQQDPTTGQCHLAATLLPLAAHYRYTFVPQKRPIPPSLPLTDYITDLPDYETRVNAEDCDEPETLDPWRFPRPTHWMSSIRWVMVL